MGSTAACELIASLFREQNKAEKKKRGQGRNQPAKPEENGAGGAWEEQPTAEGITAWKSRGNAGGAGLLGWLHHCPLESSSPPSPQSLSSREMPLQSRPGPRHGLAQAGGAAGVPQVQRRPRLPNPAGEIQAASASHFAWLQAVLLVSLLMSINHRHTNKRARRFHTAARLMEQ